MSALDPVVSARPAYLPTGPRGDYRPEHRPYRRGEEARGDDVSRNEPSTSQEAFTMFLIRFQELIEKQEIVKPCP